MPFIPHNERVEIAESKSASTPGQHCYVAYKEMVKAWNKEPRWTTAHLIYKDVLNAKKADAAANEFAGVSDGLIALDLAWQVFFQKYVMPYEDQKERENGTI